MILKKVFEKVENILEQHYNLDMSTNDVRLAFVVYRATLMDSIDYKHRFRVKRLLKQAHETFCAEIEQISIEAFERSIYRTIEKVNNSDLTDLPKIIKSMVEKVDL